MRSRDLPDRSVAGLISPLGTTETTRALSLLDAAPFFITDSDILVWPQPKLAKKLLHMKAGILPETVSAWQSKIDNQGQRDRSRNLKSLSWDGAQYAVKYQITTHDARHIWVEERGERIEGVEGKATHIKGVIKNIQSTHQAYQRAGYLAGHDDLTGLWNETRLCEGIDHAIALSKRTRNSALFLRLHITNLSQVNKNYGYEIGDLLITDVGERLQDIIRTPDLLGRIEDESFGIALYDTGQESLEALEGRIREALSDTPYATPHGHLYVEFDLSSTELANQAHSAHEALFQTQLAMSQTSRAPIIKYSADMPAIEPQSLRRKTTEDDILDALNDRRISLAYQPIICAKSRELHHYECLLRLRTKLGEVISAGRFVMDAEKLGLVDLLDRRALELASQTLRQMPDVSLALNVSAGTIKERGTADAYIAALRALGPDVQRVTLELTETVALDDPAMASRFSVETRSLGCKFAVDDFGAGYTTFKNLMAVEADTIKIDGSFIQNLSRNPNNQTFVRMMVDLAQTFNVRTVAEMVDNHADAELLKRMGVDYLQGYMFGIPSASPAWRKEAS